ncbi:protein BPS1, chloroplastic [Cryptomeria japonica]|uniref:protein BPS1, chloroplastic n=1 Tax=Cryptomeria japonica TaxID=3369 RepID=UPI0027DA6DFD|nr:protein BPS1, chloroplastic [Cryptomeria japonica]XP_057850030.2 protein BPS1, chloroplastic [Cryptomeria japonica]XP_057850031.2 protein BPS1, chloroplastic [Cryptomeria japonica]
MSRPHDGHSMFPYFSGPLRMVGPKRSSNQSSKLDQTLNAFETALTQRLNHLKTKDPEGFLTLSWMQQAMEALSATHKDLKTVIEDLKFPATEWEQKWMDQYLDDTLKVMDICIALNAEISKLQESQLLVQYVLHILAFSGGSVPCADKLDRAKGSLRDLMEKSDMKRKKENGAISMRNCKIENCTRILQGLRNGLQFGKVKSSTKGKVFLRAMYGVKATTIFVCSVVASALSGSLAPLIEVQVPDQFLWSDVFMSLQKEIHEEIKASFAKEGAAILKDLEILGAPIESMYSVVEKLPAGTFLKTGDSNYEKIRIATEKLRHGVQLLAQGLDPLTKQVNDFFQIVLNGRNELLDSLRLTGNEDEHKGDDFLRHVQKLR